MTPWQQAYTWALEHGVTLEEWAEKIEHCLLHGWIVSTPDHFLAFHKTEHNGQPAYFVVKALGGSGNVLQRFMRYAPEPLPWVLWHRNNEKRQRAFRWEQLAKKARI
jgi:hypothetical protein